jgi:addiction module HigA family antidote
MAEHPGEILLRDYIRAMGIGVYEFARIIGVDSSRVSYITQAKRSISADTALRLARVLGTDPEYWMDLQRDYDLEKARDNNYEEIERLECLVEGGL